MTHLRIELNNIQENVSSAVIEKLYELATSGYLDLSSNLAGNLHTTATYLEYIDGIRAVFPDLTISSDNIYILFLDAAVRDVLKASIGDGTGVTLALAAAATSLSGLNNNTNITSFNELRYFTSLTNLPSFAGDTNLTEIVLPNTCTTIASERFKNCTHLTTINFPTGLTTIERSAFELCSSLSGILDLSNTSVQNIKAKAFFNTSYTGAIFPTTLTTYGERDNASPLSTHLTTYKGLDNITTINAGLFGNINNAIYMGLLQTTPRFPILSSQNNGSSSPGRHSSVLQMYVPKFTNSSRTSFNGYWGALEQSLFTYQGKDGINEITIKLLYFRDILYIRRLDFYCSRIKNLVINNSTPPSFNTSATIGGDTYVNYSSWENTMFGTIPTSGTGAMTIYVPDSAVATYQADSNYNSYTIRGINEVDPNTNQPYLTRYTTNDLWEAAGKPEDALIEEYMN